MLSLEDFILQIHSDLLCPEITSAHFIPKSESYLTPTTEFQSMSERASPFCAKPCSLFWIRTLWGAVAERTASEFPGPTCVRCPCHAGIRPLFPCDWWCLLSGQVFVANPNKTQPILDILLKNQTKLIEFLSKFQNDRTEDEQFNDEKTYLVKQIRDLKRPAQQEA